MKANSCIFLIFQATTRVEANSQKRFWRRGSELNRRIKVLQTFALPLGYRALRESLLAKYRAFDCQVKLGGGRN